MSLDNFKVDSEELAEAKKHIEILIETLVEDGQGQLQVVKEAQEFLDRS